MSESDVYRRQILTSKDGPRTKGIKIFIMAVDPYSIGIRMDRKELTKTFMIYSNFKKTLVSMVYTNRYFRVIRVTRWLVLLHTSVVSRQLCPRMRISDV